MASQGDSVRMDGWKAIARYLGRDRTTAMRWAASRGLPVHRLPGGRRASVYAVGEELDAWLSSTPLDRADDPPRGPLNRRTMLALGGIGAVAAAGGLGAVLLRRPAMSPEVAALLDQARVLRGQNTRETQDQAIGLAHRAVQMEPGNADAWGMLAYARASASRWRPENESRVLREQATTEAQHALDLDPANARAELALATALPLMGRDNWLPRAAHLQRALLHAPDDPDILIEQAWIDRMTGHCRHAADMCQRVSARDFSPPLFNIWVRSLWSMGRLAEMERKLAEGMALFPSNKMLWFTRLELLVFSGRAEQAAVLAGDVTGRPSTVSEAEAETMVQLARGVLGNDSTATNPYFNALKEKARDLVRAAIDCIRFAAVSGWIDDAFALTDAYFFDRGFRVGGNNGGGLFIARNQRASNFLFEPTAAAMRTDARFGALTEELGLEAYWREARRPPDYRAEVTPA